MSFPRDMILGYGVFSYGDAGTTSALLDIGAVRGGGIWHREPVYRKRAADGDYGWVVGRVAIDEEEATLTIRALEITSSTLGEFHPAVESSQAANLTTITGKVEVAAGDYKKVRFTGYTDGGNAIMVTIDYALNMAPWHWEFLDKDEVVEELIFTAFSAEASTTTPNWTVTYATT